MSQDIGDRGNLRMRPVARSGLASAGGIEGELAEEFAAARLWNSLLDAGDPGIEILHAYTI